jgi:DNA helicase II / ATP-dependent DNA helicase PcrA
MKFIADLHIHSKFSRATSKNLDFENLHVSAQLKGITLLGTGDFTHPGWFSEIKEKLVPAGEGIYRLRPDLVEKCNEKVPLHCRQDVYFMLVSEISNIYKKNGMTRKNHNLVVLPDVETAAAFNKKLDNIGNIRSDGRPILGLDARNLLEIILETSPGGYLIPAHIWTPWFSLLGSKSGFDSVEACFEDLTPEIFCVETGLSSDPSMNWRVSDLDGLTLISNSDAHSPSKLGREANLFDTDLSYSSIKETLKTGDPKKFLGTLEFFPEEGKYHLDGHRKCKICLTPEETRAMKGICPVCAKPMTLGVSYRVDELADRDMGDKPDKRHPFYSIVPLVDVLSEIFRVGPASKKVAGYYDKAINTIGSELDILQTVPIEKIESGGIPLLSEAIKRIRNGQISISGGYDGEFGKIKIFTDSELSELMGQKNLFIMGDPKPLSAAPMEKRSDVHSKIIDDNKKIPLQSNPPLPTKKETQTFDSELNSEQKRAVTHPGGALMIVAGPGTGKTRTLTCRIAHLINNKNVSPQSILAVTFTKKAADEMKRRIAPHLNAKGPIPLVGTFHAICVQFIKELSDNPAFAIIPDEDRKKVIRDAIRMVEEEGLSVYMKPPLLLKMIVAAKQQILGPKDDLETIAPASDLKLFSKIFDYYQKIMSVQKLYDYEDLIVTAVRLMENQEAIKTKLNQRFKYIFVDEYQDMNHGQYRVVKALTPPGCEICVIGDPDQSIYGFRGSDVSYFKRFINDYPGATRLHLTRNYRSSKTILDASCQVMGNHSNHSPGTTTCSDGKGPRRIGIMTLETEKGEAVAIGKTIEKLVGGSGFHAIDFGKVDASRDVPERSFSDFAVLYRTGLQGQLISEVLKEAGIPCQMVSRESFLNRKGVADLVALLKILENIGSYADLETIIGTIRPGISRESMQIFKSWCYRNRFDLETGLMNAGRFPVPGLNSSRQLRMNAFLERIFQLQDQSKRMTVKDKLVFLQKNTKIAAMIRDDDEAGDAVSRIEALAADFDKNTEDYLDSLGLYTDTDAYEARAEKVALMTMHAAKGLEFPVVFITGCEDGYIPFNRFTRDGVDVDEERRLFYVAMTRAEETLYLTHTRKRRIHGTLETRKPSPFLMDIENDLKRNRTPIYTKTDKKNQVQLQLF